MPSSPTTCSCHSPHVCITYVTNRVKPAQFNHSTSAWCSSQKAAMPARMPAPISSTEITAHKMPQPCGGKHLQRACTALFSDVAAAIRGMHVASPGISNQISIFKACSFIQPAARVKHNNCVGNACFQNTLDPGAARYLEISANLVASLSLTFLMTRSSMMSQMLYVHDITLRMQHFGRHKCLLENAEIISTLAIV